MSERTPAGARLLEAVQVMDRLRSPGGCPWDAEQTHESLVPYLIEEAHEAVEALESGDRAEMADELGDVLLQVLFHARVAQEDPEQPFDIDDVAGGLVEKLRRRHPHVFADATVEDADAVARNWDSIKAAEKPERRHPLDGIPAGMPELARAAKAVRRLDRASAGAWARDWVQTKASAAAQSADATAVIGARLFAVVAEAEDAGIDASAALRGLLRDLDSASRSSSGP